MNKNHKQSIVKFGTIRHFMLLCLMVLLPQLAQASDWMHNSSKFSMSSSSDHVTFKPFLCDLDRSDTYAKKGGIYAKCGNRTVWLMDIHYKNEGDNENPYGKVYARYCVGEARAWFTNGYGSAEQKIEFDGKDFLIQKWGSDNHYCTPNIDFYYPASMAGNTWTFYYEYEHNDGGKFTMTLGSAYLRGDLYSSFTPKYEYERSGPDKIKFTVPALPDDVPSKLSEVHKRVGEFTVTASFTRQDNSVVDKTETFECQKGSKKTYEMEIPSDVGNPKKIDLKVVALLGLKDASDYYWKDAYAYNRTYAFPVVPAPNTLTTEFRQFDNAADLSWNAYPSGSNYYLECKPYIYRMETDMDGKAKNGSWSKRGTVDDAGNNQALGYHDNNVSAATYYKYMVLNVPKDWIGKGINESQLNNPSDDLLKKLGYVESGLMNTQPELSIYDLKQDTTVTNKVKLTWQYTRIPTTASSVTFKVMRKTSDDSEWAEFGTVNGDAQPSSGTLLSFLDGDLPNPSVRYQYKVRLTLNSTDFESDAITAGLLNGSSVKKFSATKGTHEGTVRLSWEANQVGTDNTTFVISRRYVNSDADYIRINTTSGTNTQYTYEDNTVQPGYYYEYKIEAYNGNLLQNTLTDAGFCQARGVISGRISFGSGDAVEDVRLTLRPSNADDGNIVKGYSQRVDGASTGIAWSADDTEIAKIFGKDKDYTVQMFVRPDEGMQEGAVIGEIPGVGRLRVGARSGDSYQLLLELFSDITVSEKTFTEYWRAEGCIIDTKAKEEGLPGYQNDTYGTYIYTTEDDVKDARSNIATKLGLRYSDYRGTWISDIYGGTDYFLSLYYLATQLPEPITLKTRTWTGTLLKTGLTIPANIYSLVSVQNAETVPVITVNDKSEQINPLNFVSSKEYTKEENAPLDPKYRIFDNRCLYTIDGINNDALMVYYEREKGYGRGYENYYFTTSCTATESMEENNPRVFSVGGAEDIAEEEAFKGNFAEVRVWNHNLSDKEKSYYKDRMLNGREEGLALYWPMDEGLDHYVFDASYANDMPNGRHATVGNNIAASNIVPLDNQLSRYAITNATGEYIIRGIPFVGSGSTYTILPTRGIHEFNPVSRNGFIGSGSLTLNSYDFTDTSSFPLKGKITYLNTNIPVDSVQFMIDGNMVQSKEGIRSDSNGEYEISVPIGKHLIECYKNGHKFTSFPLDGSTYDFKKAEIANFVDSTLVNVTGRVNGGFSDLDAPVGFHKSINRLGKATIKLSLGKESQCSFNYVTDDHGDGNYGTVNLPVESATDSIHSTAYRAALNATKPSDTDTHYIYITTDDKTGEFSALLPPLKYKVESITFVNDKNGDIYNDKPIFTQNLPVIDATNAIKEKMQADSVTVENGSTLKYQYSAKMIRQYRTNPTLSVVQTSPLLSKTIKNVFGERKIGVTNVDFTVDSVTVANITDNNYKYTFDHPIFVQDKAYTYDISVAESYKNLDTDETFIEVPQDAVIHIANDASSTTVIYGEDGKVNGEDVKMGEAYKTANVEITPDETGHVQYQFVAGAPNFGTGYIHNMSVGVAVDGRTTMWQAPDSKTEALDLIVLGSIGSGTNFVTRGPDAVDMILRRPPGSTSVASLANKTIRSYSHTTVESSTSGWTGGGYISETPTWEVSMGPILGIATLANSKFKIVVNQTLKKTKNYSDQDVAVNDTTYTVTEQMVTPSSMIVDNKTMTYYPEGGDTYIGRSTNLLFSKGRMLGIYKQADGTYKLDVKDGVTVGQEFDTEFVFPQAYIENTLIPNWEAIIKSKLEEGYINADHWDKNKAVAVPGKVVYYTKYKPGDPEFGRANGDKAWTKEQLAATHGYPSYMAVNGTNDPNVPDEVEDAINQIKVWRDRIADNEADKLDAFNNESSLIQNYSIASGTKVSQTTETTIKNGKTHKHEFSKSFSVVGQLGETFNDAGVIANLGYSSGSGDSNTDGSSTSVSNTVAWTMSDGDPRTALSVDVYKSPTGWGPIFRTRGGQTVNPYEAGSETKYYQPGTKLNEATMKVENPKLKVLGSREITNVPTGGQAKFILQLSNESETNDICNYVLQVNEKSNPNGAVLVVDGNILSNGKDGRLIKMKGGEIVEKTLIVTQSDRSIIDYKDIILQLKSEKDQSIESDPVKLRVHFVPSSALVELSVNHTVLNKADKDLYGGITATMSNLDRQDEGLMGIRLRYRRKGTDSWTAHKQWSDLAELQAQGYEPIPEGSQFAEKVVFLDDGLYELQAQTFGKYGADDVTYESNIIEITQDTHGPKILGMVSPENGQLTYITRNNMHLRFNEVLNGNALTKSGNFRIEGGMNNVVTGGAYADVAAQLNGSRIQTEAQYDLSNSSYAFDMWFYRQGDGTIVSLGTEDNLLSLSTHDDGKLRARVGGENDVFETSTQLPKNQWIYMALDYKRKTADDPENRITMLYVTADDKTPNYIGQSMPAKDLNSHGKLGIGGDGMQGMVSNLTIWNSDITATELYQTRNKVRASYTPGLVGYWQMDEGHGTQITDRARSRHMYMESESWYINNENRAAQLKGNSPIRVDIATFNPTKTDNYAVEFWFRGNKPCETSNQTLLSVLNGITIDFEKSAQGNDVLTLKKITHSHDETGAEEQQVEEEIQLSNKDYKDGNWHHFALNVRRGTSAIAYLDGEAVKVIPEEKIPGISGKWMLFGGEELMDTYGEQYAATYNHFTGDIDEIRIWSAALDGQLIKDRMYERMDNSYPGLVGYFPMEEISRNPQGTVTTKFSTANFGEKDYQEYIVIAEAAALTQSVNAPALKPGSTNMRLDDSQFDFTASADEIYFTFYDSSLPLMDNNDFVATVNYIKDEHGNNSETVQWKFHADFAALSWSTYDGKAEAYCEKNRDESQEIWLELENNTGMPQAYEITGLPTWLTTDEAVGTVETTRKNIPFTIAPTVPVGRHTEYIYVTDRLGIQRVLQLNVTVRGNEPNWTVDPNLYESNMMLTGQIYIDDKICENTDTKLAAFDDMGLCRGVAHPRYVPSRDAYYVDMIIYGGSATELSTGERELSFKMYNASTGNIHPLVLVSVPGMYIRFTLTYVPDASYGSYDDPVRFTTTKIYQQPISLARGWTWMSIYVDPILNNIENVLPEDATILKRFKNIKSKTAFASVNAQGQILGELKDIEPGKMYKMQLASKTDFDVYGMEIDVKETPQTIYPGYNWIGSLSERVLSPNDAFAELNPTPGDRVKNRTSFAEYSKNGIWEGTLESIVPGEGYIYRSMATEAKTFHYPSGQASTAQAREATLNPQPSTLNLQTSHYTPMDDNLYPDNMNIIAVVKKNGAEVDNAEVAGFINGECRGAVSYNKGYYFLTVLGSSEDDANSKLAIKVWVDGEEYVVDNSLPFISDAFYGSLEEPYVLDIDATAISVIESSADDDDDDWYTLQGLKIGRRPTQQGIYIHKGKTVTIKWRK